MSVKKIVLYIGIALLTFVTTGQALAHGIGTPVKIFAPSGPYLLSIWTDPNPLRIDETHVTVAVMKPETQEPIVTGVEVTVKLTAVANESLSFTAPASADNTANRLLYSAVFNNLPLDGRWRGIVSVAGPAGAGEDVSFEIEVLPPAPFSWLWLGGIGLFMLLVVWWVQSWRQSPSPLRPSEVEDQIQVERTNEEIGIAR